MSCQVEETSIARVGEGVRYDVAVSTCLVRLAEVRPAAVAIEAAVYLVLVVTMTVCFMRCFMRGEDASCLG